MKTIAGKLSVLCGLIVLLAAATTRAGSGVVSIYKIDGLISGTTVRAGQDLRFVFRYNNSGAAGTARASDVSNGFKISSPDGAVWDSVKGSGLGDLTWFYDSAKYDPDQDTGIIDTVPQWSWFAPRFSITFGIVPKITYSHRSEVYDPTGNILGLLAAGFPRMATTFNDSTWSITAYFHDKSAAGKHICVDSSFFGTGGTWKWVGSNLVDYFPTFEGLTPTQPYSGGLPDTRLGSGYCFDLYAPLLTVSTTQLTFTAEAGGSNPPSQTFDVTSTGDALGDHLSFGLIETASWLNKSPTTGTTPRNIQVSANIAGLSAGTYTDSIRVESAGAGNSPLYVRVILNVTSPAPTISVSKSSLSFVGLEGGSNPSPQTFIVKNTGGGILNWSLNHVQPWLNLLPASGLDSAQVSASVSLAGLLTGEYLDTIVVSDPAATNDPVKIAVKLSIGSSLPAIVVDSAINHILLTAGSSINFSRRVFVRNGGVGALTYSITENSSRIQTVVPTAGVAPESVQVNFKLSGVSNLTYHDTIWVSSPEATNSPYPVVFLTRIVDTPAVINVSRDTISFITYLCTQGPTSPLPQDVFHVYNAGGGDPMIVDLVFESELFTVSPTGEEAPILFTVDANYPDLLVGIYYDTILVTSEWATNSPQRVIIRYERSAGTQWEIRIPADSIIIAKQEHTGPADVSFRITNLYPGCMPWSLDEEIPWFTPFKTSGNAPDWFRGLVDVEGLVLGEYRDSMYFVVPGATNSPKRVDLIVRVWRYHGDCNWSGFVDVVDLSWLISFLTTGEPVPRPEYPVGDINCDEMVDLIDLSYLVAYLTTDNVHLCGNP